jgi:hypothetical protein
VAALTAGTVFEIEDVAANLAGEEFHVGNGDRPKRRACGTVMMLLVRRKSVMGDLVVGGPVYWLGWVATAEPEEVVAASRPSEPRIILLVEWVLSHIKSRCCSAQLEA